MVILFALMAHGQEGDEPGFLYLEQCNVAGFTEGDDHLPQERIFRQDLAAGEGKNGQEFERLGQGVPGAAGSGGVVLQEEGVEPVEVLPGTVRCTW